MDSITETLLTEQEGERATNPFTLPLLLALLVVMAAMFIGEMLFGKNSLEVYLTLNDSKTTLEKKIYHLKNENAALQKKYFELKNLMPTKEEE